jgi:hypothetical protein
MKDQSTKAVKSKLKRRMDKVLIIILGLILFIPGIGMSQTPGGPNPPGPGNGSNPDNTLGVPFDGRMNVMLLFAGVLFAVAVFKRLQKKKILTNRL